MIAAATTSLPETPGGERNWDYRYAWIRDSTFMLWGLYTLGFDEEANDFFYFIGDVASTSDGELQIMYGIGGEETLTEEMLRPPRRLRARPAGARRQRRLQPAASTTCGARCSTRSTCTRSRATGWPSRRGRSSSKQVEHAIAALARARPRHLGGPRRAAALHLVEGHVLGRLRPRRAAGAAARGPRARERWQAGGRRDPRRHLRERRRRARRLPPALRHRRARRLVPAASRSCASCRPTTSA